MRVLKFRGILVRDMGITMILFYIFEHFMIHLTPEIVILLLLKATGPISSFLHFHTDMFELLDCFLMVVSMLFDFIDFIKVPAIFLLVLFGKK